METKKINRKKSMKLSLFFEKINTIDKQPDSSIKKKAQINKIRNEKKSYK